MNTKKMIFTDCAKAMSLALLLYSLEGIISGILKVYTANVSGSLADAIFNFDQSFGLSNFWKLLLSVGATVFFMPILNTVGEVFMFSNSLKHDGYVLGRFLDKYYTEAMKLEEGEIQHRIENDPCDFRILFVLITVKSLTVLVTTIFLMVAVLNLSAIYSLIAFLISLVKFIVPIIVKKIEAKYDKETREYETSVRVYENEIASNPAAVKQFGLKTAFIGRLDQIYRKFFHDVFVKSVRCTTLADNISSFLTTFCTIAVLLVGAILTATDIITPGAIMAMLGYFSVFGTIIGDVDYIIRNIPILHNVFNRMTIFYEGFEDTSGANITEVTEIEANDLSFCYGEQSVFKGLNFHIRKGTKINLSGANGSGKSTLIKLLCGLLKTDQGHLKLNGVTMDAVAIESWRSQIAYAEQDPFLFSCSVKDNIKIGNLSATDEEIYALMDEMNISYLKDREIVSGQSDLSGGERQKISIARALLKNTDFLILDEPNNHLDAQTIQWLKELMEQSSKTILLVSHDSFFGDFMKQKIKL